MPKVILIAGPTASGKSALSLNLAREFDGEIVNADSMQVYDCLQVLTARPSESEMEGIPHHLYGVVAPDDAFSAARWCADVLPVLQDILSRGKTPIIAGGTGLYFKALEEGLSHVPAIEPQIREEIRTLARQDGQALYEQLKQEDPEMAARLKPGDRQRVARALEVLRSTGRSLLAWQAEKGVAPLSQLENLDGVARIVLMPDRQWLYERCDRRFGLMMEQGALDEVKAVQHVPADLPAMRALGVGALRAYLEEEITLDDAIIRAQTQTRQYAKRQMTWFRNQFDAWNHCNEQQSESLFEKNRNIIINN